MLKAFSFGGGVQSTAAMILAAQGRIDYRAFVFANVGEDSENPATVRYMEEHAKPFMAAHGLEFHEVQRRRKDGSPDTLMQLLDRDLTSIRIPVRMSVTGKPGNRGCTGDFKIKPIQRWFREQGATAEDPAVCGVGISWDEVQRMRSSSGVSWQILDYPLIDLRLDREACRAVISAAGLPQPPKSSCWFCPFHRLQEWRRMFDEEPELFAAAVALEKRTNERRASQGLTPVWLTSRSRPLDEVVTGGHQGQLTIWDAADGQEVHHCGPFVCSTGGVE